MKSFIWTVIFSFFFFWANTQEILPKNLTAEEIEFIESGKHIKQLSLLKDAPPGNVRLPAEWEEMQAVIITWQGFSFILSQIVEALIDDVQVYIVCNNENTVMNYLTSQGIDYEGKVSFFEISSNSIWVRDYGPNSAYLEETGELVWIDWIYNRPRYQDNAVPVNLGDILNIPVYSTNSAPEDLVNTGGNFMTDGMGYGFSSDLVLDENGNQNQYGVSNHSEEDIDAIMQQYMGVESYIKMEALPYDLIHHIDMHMKIIDEETMIVGEYPEGIADGPQIEANIQYVISNFKTAYDRDFNIIRVPMPPEGTKYPDTGGDYRTYANALIANKTIIVPTYEVQYDTTALRIWKEAMPGYDVKGINCNQIIPLSGALHCITKEVAADNPITIQMSTENTWCSDAPFVWEGSIQSNSDITSAKIHYNVDNQGYEELDLLLVDDINYTADLGLFELGSSLEYYIEVSNEDGKTMHRPLPGIEGPRTTKIENCAVSSLSEITIEQPDVFPNPASAITCIDLKKSYNHIKVELYDVLGNKALEINNGASAQKLFFDASSLQSGAYVLRFETNGVFYNYKMIIK